MRWKAMILALAALAIVLLAPTAEAKKGENLRIIVALEETIEDPNIRIHICTEDQGVLLNGKRKNPRRALAVGIADTGGYGNVTVFSDLNKFRIVANNISLGADGLVVHIHTPNGEGEGETVTEETFNLIQNTFEGEITEAGLPAAQIVLIADIPMDPNADQIDVDDAVELVKRAALVPESPDAGTAGPPGEIFLAWRSVDPDGGVDRYSIYRGTTGAVTQQTGVVVIDELEMTGDPLTFTDTGLAPGIYFYVITASQDDGLGGTRESIDSKVVFAQAL